MIHIISKKGAPYFTADPMKCQVQGLEQVTSKGPFQAPPQIHGHTGTARFLFMVLLTALLAAPAPMTSRHHQG